MSNKSMIETAYDVFVKQGNSPKSLSFKELCQAVRDELGITDDEEFISKVGTNSDDDDDNTTASIKDIDDIA